MMAKSVKQALAKGEKRLKMIMRDVMAGLTDSAGYFAFRSTQETLEILSIAPRRVTPFCQAELCNGHPLAANRPKPGYCRFPGSPRNPAGTHKVDCLRFDVNSEFDV